MTGIDYGESSNLDRSHKGRKEQGLEFEHHWFWDVRRDLTLVVSLVKTQDQVVPTQLAP